MAGEPITTIVGTLGSDPELRFTPSGAAVANFSVAQTPRTKNANTQEWEDGETLWVRCNVWREMAENVAESLTKGTRVIVQGRLKQRTWEDKEGNRRLSIEMDVDAIGPELRWATAKVIKAQRGGGGGGYMAPAGAGDPWSTQAGAGTGSDDPPF